MDQGKQLPEMQQDDPQAQGDENANQFSAGRSHSSQSLDLTRGAVERMKSTPEPANKANFTQRPNGSSVARLRYCGENLTSNGRFFFVPTGKDCTAQSSGPSKPS
jgi:hypothetical protein